MSNLVIITFSGEETASEAMTRIRAVERAGGFGLTDSAVIIKDAAGDIHVKNEWSSGAETGAVVGGVLGAMVTFFFPIAGAALGAGAGAFIGSRLVSGVDGKFVDDVANGLAPSSSAIFLMVKDGADPAALVAAFGGLGGTVYQTSLSPDFEDSLRRSLHRPSAT